MNRFHRTLKEKILKYARSSGTTRWIDVIDKIIIQTLVLLNVHQQKQAIILFNL